MRQFGVLLIFVGVIWLIIAFNMDTSVATGGGIYLPDRVENIGLIAQRQNHLYMGGLVTIIGVLLTIFGARNEASSETNATSGVRGPHSNERPPERDLTKDPYRLWLAEKYQIKRNEVFDKFVFDQHTYETLDEALQVAHACDLAEPGTDQRAGKSNESKPEMMAVPVLIVVIGVCFLIALLF